VSREVTITTFRINRELWRKFKAKVYMEGKTVTEVLNELIKEYLNEGRGVVVEDRSTDTE